MSRYNEVVTNNYGLGAFPTTRGVMYEQWRTMQSPTTWGTLTFDEWDKAGMNGQQVSWKDWEKTHRASKAQGEL